MQDMQECEHYEECLNDPTRDKEMEERCRECNDISDELLNHPDLEEGAGPSAVENRSANELHLDELKEVASLMGDVESAISIGDYDQAAEQCRIAKWRLERRIEIMFS